MPSIHFALKADKYVWEALVETCAPARPEPLVGLAAARLRAFLPREATVTRHGAALVVVHPDLPADAMDPTALALERVVSGEPYPAGDGHVFLPFPCAGVMAGPSESAAEAAGRAKKAVADAHRSWAALVWHGSIASSRLFLYCGSARIGGDARCEIPIEAVDRPVACVEQKGHHIYISPLDDPSRALFNGRPVARRRFYGPKALFVVPDPGREPSTVLLFEGASQAASFRNHPAFMWDSDDGGSSQWAYVALARAMVSSSPCGVILVTTNDWPKDDAIERWRRAAESIDAPPGAARDVSAGGAGLAIVLDAPAADVEAHAEALRRRLAGDDGAVVAHAIAAPGELPAAVVARARALARA